LRANLDGEEFRIDHPRRTLEEFFLDVIATAKRESVETSGVVSSGKIADYLAPDADKNTVLENLLATPEVKIQTAETVNVKSETASERIAEALKETVKVPEEKSAPETVAPDAVSAEKLANANRKLDSLLGNLDGNQEK
jgi:ABC-2 type transport system ATP-binding protein